MTTNATKHTPGPWSAERRNAHATLHVVAGHFRVFLGTHKGAPAEEWDANARLIASAPDLLAERARLRAENAELRRALEQIADEIPRCQGNATGLFAYARGWLEIAHAALAKRDTA